MKFGVREVCDVTFKALTNTTIGNTKFEAGQPVFMIDTATTSEMSRESTTVYAQGGKGYSRLIAWEGEETMTFKVTDALMSPMGLAVLSGAGLINAGNDNLVHMHITMNATVKEGNLVEIKANDICDELGLENGTDIYVCTDEKIKPYITVVDSVGAATDYSEAKFVEADKTTKITDEEKKITGKETINVKPTNSIEAGKSVIVDFYIVMNSNAQSITIEPGKFGGYFYVEADTLFRDEATGKDYAASITFPRVKVQSAFTFTMAPTGDPSTFDFTMDAFPARTYFSEKKVACQIDIITGNDNGGDGVAHSGTHSF